MTLLRRKKEMKKTRRKKSEERRVKNLDTNIFLDALIKGGRAWGLSGSLSAYHGTM